jgi:hypothetical protein
VAAYLHSTDVGPWEQISDVASRHIASLVSEVRKRIPLDSSISRFRGGPIRVPLFRADVQLLRSDRFSQVLEHRCNEWVQAVYEICCRAWAKLKRKRTASFVESVWTYGIEPFIEEQAFDLLLLAVELNPSEEELLDIPECDFTRQPEAEVAQFKVLLAKRAKDNTRYRWQKKIETEIEQSHCSSGTPREMQPKLAQLRAKNRRSTDLRKVAIATIKARDRGVSASRVCIEMDRKQERNPALGPLNNWVKRSGKRTWTENFENQETKPLVRKYISLIKCNSSDLI